MFNVDWKKKKNVDALFRSLCIFFQKWKKKTVIAQSQKHTMMLVSRHFVSHKIISFRLFAFLFFKKIFRCMEKFSLMRTNKNYYFFFFCKCNSLIRLFFLMFIEPFRSICRRHYCSHFKNWEKISILWSNRKSQLPSFDCYFIYRFYVMTKKNYQNILFLRLKCFFVFELFEI